MCNANHSIIAKVQELQEYRKMQEEIEAQIKALEAEVKDYMGDDETMFAGSFKVTFKTVTSTRFDAAALRKDYPQLCAEYMKQTTVRRFQIS